MCGAALLDQCVSDCEECLARVYLAASALGCCVGTAGLDAKMQVEQACPVVIGTCTVRDDMCNEMVNAQRSMQRDLDAWVCDGNEHQHIAPPPPAPPDPADCYGYRTDGGVALQAAVTDIDAKCCKHEENCEFGIPEFCSNECAVVRRPASRWLPSAP